MQKPIAVIIAAFFFAASISPARAEESADIRKLLDTLRADDFDARESAKKKLIERGEAIRGLLTAELEKKDLDPDYKDYLKSILGKLKDSDILKLFDNPRRIDLDIKDETVAAVIEKLKTQFGLAIEAKGDPAKKKITLQIKNATFLEAVDAVRKAANLAYDRNGILQMAGRRRGRNFGENAPTLSLRDNGDDALVPAAAKGPVLVFFEAINYQLSRSINFQNEGKKNAVVQKSFNLQGYVLVEPDVRFSEIAVSNFTAIGANNETVGTGMVSLTNYNYWDGGDSKGGFRIYNFNMNFVPQADPPAALTWKLSAKLSVPVKLSEKKFENLADLVGKPQEILGGSFTLNKFEHNGGQWYVSYTTTGALMEMSTGGRQMRWNPGAETAASGNPEFASGMYFLDDKGKSVSGGGYSGSGGNNSYRVDTEFAVEPKSILFRKPGETQTRTFELEIPNVPVP